LEGAQNQRTEIGGNGLRGAGTGLGANPQAPYNKGKGFRGGTPRARRFFGIMLT